MRTSVHFLINEQPIISHSHWVMMVFEHDLHFFQTLILDYFYLQNFFQNSKLENNRFSKWYFLIQSQYHM